MVGDGQPVARLEYVVVLMVATCVLPEADVLAELEHARKDVLDPLVHERFAAADRDDRRRALYACVDAFVHCEPRLVRLVLADLPAADARDVAGERRLEHEDERIPLPLALLAGDVAADLHG